MNIYLLTTINGWSGNPGLDEVMFLAAKWLIFPVGAVLAVLVVLRLLRRDLRPVLLAGATLAIAFALSLGAAALIPEQRPFQQHSVRLLFEHAAGQSFPSDHATAAFGVALAVFAFLSRPWGTVLLVAAALIGFARVYAGVHYPVDIAGAALVALIAVLLVAAANHLVPITRSAPRTSTR